MGTLKVVKPGDSVRPIHGAGDVYNFLVTGDDTHNSYSFVDALVPPGGGPPPHIHTREDEVFYVLEGELVFRAGGQMVTATPGTLLHAPRGIAHHFRNESDQAAHMVFFFVPAGVEEMFEKMGADPNNFIAIGKEYGVEFVEQA